MDVKVRRILNYDASTTKCPLWILRRGEASIRPKFEDLGVVNGIVMDDVKVHAITKGSPVGSYHLPGCGVGGGPKLCMKILRTAKVIAKVDVHIALRCQVLQLSYGEGGIGIPERCHWIRTQHSGKPMPESQCGVMLDDEFDDWIVVSEVLSVSAFPEPVVH